MTSGEAVNWIANLSADIGRIQHQDLWHYEQALDEISKLLESAEPEHKEHRWIPVSERLPEEGEYVLLSIIIGTFDDAFGYILPGKRLEIRGETVWVATVYRCKDKVVAWMPLPEPYREADDA